ncbi:DUF1489 family protein [Paremcibacter congregatus]|uniref:Lysophospholipase n=1 Tax=Paremcibacter congregatus TaxID=2043170 RepID=A0A2G4YMY6_9PROT|nr:DUF1489 domain-containing protein [Paremcibacter congregatus]PHZ83665.1 lysophospholipase [Paremcibacter congregatus]QDE27368.1 DUF1489 family protein [Paremcibacter congregatus]
MTVHILKLCVGIDSIEHLIEVRQARSHFLPDGTPYNYHITRARPKRAVEVLDGGSIYWVIKGFIQVRQRIIGLEPVETDTGVKCKFVMDTNLVRTESQPRRPHQGWRYLDPKDAPKDIADGARSDSLPEDMSQKLRDLGLL